MQEARDFKNLSDAELALAKVYVDASLAPIDHDNLRGEMRRRKAQRAASRLPCILRAIGGLLVVGAVAGAIGLRVVLESGRVMLPVMVLPLILWAVAGVLLLKARPTGVPLGVAALSLQSLSFAIGGIAYAFSPLLGAQIAWYGGEIVVSFTIGPFGYLRAEDVQTTRFAIDVLAMAGMYFLLKSLWGKARAA